MWPACAHACVTFFFIAVSTSVHAPSRLPLHKDHNVLVWLGASAGGSPYGSGHAAREAASGPARRPLSFATRLRGAVASAVAVFKLRLRVLFPGLHIALYTLLDVDGGGRYDTLGGGETVSRPELVNHLRAGGGVDMPLSAV